MKKICPLALLFVFACNNNQDKKAKDFDKDYISLMTDDQKQVVDDLEKAPRD